MLETINWSLFTEEQKDIVTSLVQLGEWEKLTSAISIDSLEVEEELNKIIVAMRPKVIVNESLVEQELKEKEMKEGFKIETPEQEQEWQKKFDEEKALQKKEFDEQYKVSQVVGEEVEKEEKKRPGRPKTVKTEEENNVV